MLDPDQGSIDFGSCVATWGDHPPVSAMAFNREDCWALRRSHGHYVDRDKQGLFSQHISQGDAIGASLCIPLGAQGKSLGLLHLWSPDPHALSKAKRRLANTIAEHLALSVTNLRLRASLELQSTRDSLTGLFNRRYMEDALERLLYKAEAQNSSLGIIMIDIDRFKNFNDRYGHAIGDLVLRKIAALNLSKDGRLIEQVTASFGIAVFPECGRDRRELLRVADDARYRAKNEGRNCVRLAEAIVEAVTAIDPSYPRRSSE